MDGRAKGGELETKATSALRDSEGVIGGDFGTGGIVGVGACVDAVVPGSAPVATISESCRSLPSRGSDNVGVEVMSCAAATIAVGNALVRPELG